MRAVPFTAAEFAASLDRIAQFERRPLIAVAVSGGPDSLALMLLAAEWARERGGAASGLTVDHRLRPESGAEACRVGAWLAARGISHRVLVWSEPKPASGVQEAAREARYALLADWCRAQGCLHLLTAHHREDQAETHLIRRRAQSGPDGLAAMSGIRELVGCRVLRPLLDVPKARLLALLEAEGQPFLSDPGNTGGEFERSRLRLETGGEGGRVELPAMLQHIRDLGHARIAREAAVADLLARAVALHPAGFGVLDPALLAAAPPPIAERALSRLARSVGGGRYPPRSARIARLREALAAEPVRARTLGGCRFAAWRGRVLVTREVALAEPPHSLRPGEHIAWDRRFVARLGAAAHYPLTLGYLGTAGAAELARVVPGFTRARVGDRTPSPPQAGGKGRGEGAEQDDLPRRPPHPPIASRRAPPSPPTGRRGEERAAELGSLALRRSPPVLPRLLHPILPAFRDREGLLFVPHLGYRREADGALPELAFDPEFSLTQAGFTVV
ncbi:MAG: tRNA lysidine(34) synthetase TilS [Alphaproteobacteria bacterium]|nr:tRNA lysidine(34) synthetase TilS [Alphaproteobacteria bacterium]